MIILLKHSCFLCFQKLAERFSDDGSVAELAMVGPEHPSPVSVLDASIYRDDSPSPVKQIPDALKGNVPIHLLVLAL